jgi:hypothetical protein
LPLVFPREKAVHQLPLQNIFRFFLDEKLHDLNFHQQMPISNPLLCPRWDRAGRTPGVRTDMGCCGKNAVKFLGRRPLALEEAEKNHVGVGGV